MAQSAEEHQMLWQLQNAEVPLSASVAVAVGLVQLVGRRGGERQRLLLSGP
jgi:hypothetical protein